MKQKAKDLFVVASLAIIAGWSSASALMAGFMWIGNPEKKEMLIEAFRDSGFIFMPPLFGDSPRFYVACTVGISITCYLIVLFMRLRKKTEPNQSLQTTTMAVTDAAAQPPRQP
jgi:hypothetical protein